MAIKTTKKDNIGGVDMWGDPVVGSTNHIFPVPPPKMVTSKPVKFWGNYTINPEGQVLYDYGSGTKKVELRGRGSVKFFRHGLTRKEVDLKQLVAENFIPNPANLPYVRVLRNGEGYSTRGLTWSSFKTVEELRKTASQAERFPRKYEHIFNPKVEVPVTITLFSRI